jgi:HK97 family phage portal protein
MTTLPTADGRLLKVSGPTYGGIGGRLLPTTFPPMWSDGERYPNGLTDRLDGALASFDSLYRSQPVLAGVIDMMAMRAASLPCGPFTQNALGQRDALPRSDSLATLLRRPRPGQSTVHLLSHVFTSLFTHGNAVVAKVRTVPDEPPMMLWPLDWSYLTAYARPGGMVEWWSTTEVDPAQELFMRAEDVVHFAWSPPSGSQVGISPLEKLGVTIKIEDAAQRFQAANFRNGNRPANAISFAGNLTPKQRADNAEALALFHGGPDGAGGTLLLGGDAKVANLSFSPVEVALIEQRRLDREEIAIVFGLSGPSLTDSTNSALGNVVERFRAFYRDVLPPWATLVVETLEAQLCDPEPGWMDRLVRFDFSDKLRGEPREHAEKLKIEVEAGLRTRNEGRYELGLGPEGDPNDPENPANRLTMNVNNQAALGEGGADSDSGSPTLRE